MIRNGKMTNYTILPIDDYSLFGDVNARVVAYAHIGSISNDYNILIGVICVTFSLHRSRLCIKGLL